MNATIRINMDNSAFANDWQNELASILDNLAKSLRNVPSRDRAWSLRDANGNTVGMMGVTGTGSGQGRCDT